MGCATWSRALPPPPANPRIQVRPRYLLASLSDQEKAKERDRLIVRIGQKRIDFCQGSSAFSAYAEEVLRNVAEVLLEYPELALDIESYPADTAGKKEPDKEAALAQMRAEACRERLLDLGVLSELFVSVCEDGQAGRSATSSARPPGSLAAAEPCVLFRAQEGYLLGPQARLDYLFTRTGFDFLPRSADLSEKGLKVAEVVAKVIKETPNRVIIAVPKICSDLAHQRAEAIAQGLQEMRGCGEISVEIAKGHQKYATVRIEDDPADYLDPQRQLVEILKETPLAFRMNSSELVPEVLPAIKRCADVLKEVKDMCILIEAYSGAIKLGEAAEARTREVMLRRAERVGAWLQAEGVEIPILSKGFATSLSDGGSPSNARSAARVVLTLIHPEEQELAHLAADEQEVEGCMGGMGNILGCL